jgi:hypothetical protein
VVDKQGLFSGAVGMIAHVENSLKILDDKTEKMNLDRIHP